MSLVSMIRTAREARQMNQKEFAGAISITPQYLCDLEQGRRLGSVEVVNRICDLLGIGDRARRKWHVAGARSHGWNV